MSSDGINDFSENISSIETAKDYNDTEDIEEIEIDNDLCWCVPLVCMFFPPFFVQLSLSFEVKKVLKIDKKNNQIIVVSKNIFGCDICCKKRILFLDQIKKCKLYLVSYPSKGTVGFDIRMSCDIESVLGFKDLLFYGCRYKPEIFKKLGDTLKKYVDTEIENLQTKK